MKNMKNIILEEINRNKLLMNYNSEITLSENVEKVSILEGKLLVEQGRATLLKSILGVADETAALALKRVKNAKYVAGVNLFDDVEYVKVGFKQDKIFVMPCNVEDDGIKLSFHCGARRIQLNVKTRLYIAENFKNVKFGEKEITLVQDKSTKYFSFDIC
jgi:hypothetical protein